jgi:hypothetical protein
MKLAIKINNLFWNEENDCWTTAKQAATIYENIDELPPYITFDDDGRLDEMTMEIHDNDLPRFVDIRYWPENVSDYDPAHVIIINDDKIGSM